MVCRARVAQLRNERSKIEGAGAKIVVIGSGTVEQGAEFQKSQGIDFEVLADPDRLSYRAIGLRRGILPLLTWKTMIFVI